MMLQQSQTTLQVPTRGRGLVEITRPVVRWIVDTGIADGLLTLFVRQGIYLWEHRLAPQRREVALHLLGN